MFSNVQLGGVLKTKKMTPDSIIWWHIKNWIFYRWKEIPFSLFLLFYYSVLRYLIPGLNVIYGCTYITLKKGNGEIINYGLAGRHLITTAGKNYVAGCFNNTNEAENLKYHGYGTGTTAPANGDTTLETELTTQYASDNTRPTGSQSVSTNTYTTVGTLSPDSGGTIAVTEWGLLSQAANSGGTLFDRQTFSAINLVAANGDSLQTTYTLTVS